MEEQIKQAIMYLAQCVELGEYAETRRIVKDILEDNGDFRVLGPKGAAVSFNDYAKKLGKEETERDNPEEFGSKKFALEFAKAVQDLEGYGPDGHPFMPTCVVRLETVES